VYIKRPAMGSVITNVFSILKESLQQCCRRRRGRDTEVLNTLAERCVPFSISFRRGKGEGGRGKVAKLII